MSESDCLIAPEALVAAGRSMDVLDCRFDLMDTDAGERDWRAAHIPSARYVHLERHLSGPDRLPGAGGSTAPEGR